MPLPITATIITLNEEKNIEAVIASAKEVCDEIIVVDSGSVDRTVELARAAGARVVVQPFLGDGRQKDFGVDLAKNDWILSIDADERLDRDAVEALGGLDLGTANCDGFSLRRKNFIGSRWVKIWYPDELVRLYNRSRCRYTSDHIHACVAAAEVKKLPAHILHYSYAGYRDYMRGAERYAGWGAEVLISKGRRANLLSPLVHGLGGFFRQYLARGGWKGGLDGLVVAVTTGYLVFMKYVFILEKQREKKQTD